MEGIGRALVVAALSCGVACDSVTSAETDTDTDGTTSTTGTAPPNSTTTGARFDQTAACVAWLECLTVADREQLLPQYGPEGSCWSETASAVEMCDATCVEGYNAECAGGSHGGGGGDEASSGAPDTGSCALETLAPGAESWVEAGDEPALIPTEIGGLLEEVCSCHVSDLDEFIPRAPLYHGNARFYTYAQMQAQFEGAPMYVEVGIRALDELNMPPVYYCGDNDFGSLTADEYAVLDAWIEADAPDGAQWIRVRPDSLPTLE